MKKSSKKAIKKITIQAFAKTIEYCEFKKIKWRKEKKGINSDFFEFTDKAQELFDMYSYFWITLNIK